MMKMKELKQILDRFFNKLLYSKRCVKITFKCNYYDYNDRIIIKDTTLRCLGKDWYKQLKHKKWKKIN